jgi:hypothetical protein
MPRTTIPRIAFTGASYPVAPVTHGRGSPYLPVAAGRRPSNHRRTA